MGFYEGKRVAVTGGRGFLAHHLIEALLKANASVVSIVRGSEKSVESPRDGVTRITADLQHRDQALRAFDGVDHVFHLAAVGWGFHENLKRQPELLTENLLLNSTVLDAAHRAGAKSFLLTSSSAVYPGEAEVLDEELSWNQPPHPGEACFGWAKRMAEIQARAYYEHHGWPVAIVRPTNPYGPYDCFDPQRSHVIPALIRRALSGEQPFTVWGSGNAIRSFVHAQDVVEGMLLALEHASDATPINLASPESMRVRDVVGLVLEACGRSQEEIVFDLSKPDGPPRKVASMARLQGRLGKHRFVTLKDGIQETVDWCRQHILRGAR